MDPERLIKLVRYILSRRPDEFGLCPEEGGWFKVRDLHLAVAETEGFRGVRRRELETLLEVFGRDEFEYLREEGRVRAREIHFAPPVYVEEVPRRLYLPVKPRAWIRVVEEGLRAPHPVLMAPERDLAERLARRRGALLVEVDTTLAQEDGAVFLRFMEKLYLSTWLPARALRGPRVDEKFRARYLPSPRREPEPEPIIPFRVESAEDQPYRKITRGKKKKLPWKEGRKRKKNKDW
ncbi:hypothetical protein [Thermosulfurimonas sp.]|uniref:hypothetical protein n=1 Tax=Thermosulfurimonas sp. TaxID=2080236 RepID=UPI0025CFB8AA|nr:hypothetical protein [Thermosulfurimonas sp.]